MRAEVRRVQRQHQGQGWADIGYHLLLSQDGTWFQGRPWIGASTFDEAVRESAWAMGSHVRSKNTGRIGLSVMGWFHAPKNHEMTPAATASLERMIKRLSTAYGLSRQSVVGHRELGSTACPGDRLIPIVEQIRARL